MPVTLCLYQHVILHIVFTVALYFYVVFCLLFSCCLLFVVFLCHCTTIMYV